MTVQEFKSYPRKRRKPVQRESELQKSCVLWFRSQYPQYAQLLFSIPNGGKRNIITASRMKAEGQVAGVPDLMLAVARKGYHAMFIEMKAGKNKPSILQSQLIDHLTLQSYGVRIAYSLEGFQTIINSYLS